MKPTSDAVTILRRRYERRARIKRYLRILWWYITNHCWRRSWYFKDRETFYRLNEPSRKRIEIHYQLRETDWVPIKIFNDGPGVE